MSINPFCFNSYTITSGDFFSSRIFPSINFTNVILLPIFISCPFAFKFSSYCCCDMSALYTFISSISEPFGAFLCFIFIGPYVNRIFLGFLFSLISGIMLYISIYELLKESLSYNKKYLTIIFYLIGSIFTILNSIFF